jgi:hypothetical protein
VRLGREQPLLLRDVLLEDVGLQRPAEVRRCQPCRSAATRTCEQRHRRGVDRHRGRDLAQRQPVEEPLHVGDGVDRDTAVADLALGPRVVGVEAHQGRHVERDRQPVLAAVHEVVEALVGLDGVREPGELPDGPRAGPVHRRVDAARVGVHARVADPLEVEGVVVKSSSRSEQPGNGWPTRRRAPAVCPCPQRSLHTASVHIVRGRPTCDDCGVDTGGV